MNDKNIKFGEILLNKLTALSDFICVMCNELSSSKYTDRTVMFDLK